MQQPGSGAIVLDPEALQGRYRCPTRAPPAWLETKKRPRDEPAPEAPEAPLAPEVSEELEAWRAAQPDVQVPAPVVQDEAPLQALLARQQALVYQAFHYLSESATARLTPAWADLLSLLGDRCRPLVEPVARLEPQVRALWRAFVQRLLVEMLAEDATGLKIREVRAQLDEAYLLDAQGRAVRGARSALANVDRVRAETHACASESLDVANDEFYRRCAGPKKRGRRPGSEKKQELNQLQKLKKRVIDLKKGGSSSGGAPPVDTYPLFVQVLAVVANCVPDAQRNHGWFLAVVERAMRAPLSAAEWPARGLVRALMNAERVLERRRLVLDAELLAQGPLYCAYSGAQLRPGDQVWHLRLVLCSGARHKKWERRGRRPAVPYTDAFFTRSVRAYLVRCEVSSLCSLFWAPLPATEPELPTVALETRPSGLPTDRRFCVNTLYLLLGQLRGFIAHNGLAAHVFDARLAGRTSYATENARLCALLDAAGPAQFRRDLRTVLLLASFGDAGVQRFCAAPEPPHPNIALYGEMLLDTVLDFVDTHFVFAAGQGQREVLTFAQFNLERLGVVLGESEQSRKRFVAQHGKLAQPRLQPRAQALLARLLALSAARHAERESVQAHQEQRERLWRLQWLVARHPFLFMTLYDALFQAPAEAKQPPRLAAFPDALTLLCRLHLSINTEAT